SARPVSRPSGPRASRPALCRGCGVPLTTAAQRTAARCPGCPPRYDPAVFEALQDWRRRTAQQAQVPAYVVFTDATLEVLAERRPRAVAELAGIPGVGAVKLDRYGAGVVAAVTAAAGAAGVG
ncbi:HRDC domain-containing protein, partial [Aquipuribacter sp. SD81]|uniref:HRDC domain-containing protein n=1 Tax=Aquipuribacter sp. SD81 TaxID=3127703 RepID=UPI003016521C